MSKRYFVPGLIPARYRVLPELFVSGVTSAKKNTSPVDWLGFLLFFLAAWSVMMYSLVFAACLSLLSLLFLPPFVGWLQRMLRFELTSRLKRRAFAVLVAFSVVPAYNYPEKVRLRAVRIEQERLAEIRRKQQELDRQKYLAKKEELRKETIRQQILTAERSINKRKYVAAISQLEKLKAEIQPGDEELRTSIDREMAEAYSGSGNYVKAIGLLDDLLTTPDGQAYFLRAVCYQKTHKIEQAVADAYRAGQQGSREGERLYNRLNPERRRLLYYQTVCCDGSYSPSNAKGSGACSHHGGVCNWNLPIYETYRKYNVSSF